MKRILRLRLVGAAVLSLLAAGASADAPRTAPAPAPRAAATQTAAIQGAATQSAAVISGATLAAASRISGAVGFIVIDLESGAVLEALNPDTGLAPASVAKVATTLYALAALGPQHRFETQVLALGPIEAGRLRGDLGLRGGGDPELDSAGLADLARVAAEQARVVDGAVRVTQGAAIPFIDADQPPEASYNPAVAALNLNYNRVRLAWERKGGKLDYALEAHAAAYSPAVTSVALTLAPNDCGCPAFARDADGSRETWRVREGALNGRGSVWLPVQAPAPYAAEVFRAAAAQAGMRIGAGPKGGADSGAVIARHVSRPVVEMAADMLRYSTNLTAEALGRAASAARGAPTGDLEASAAAMNRWVADFAGFPAGPDFALLNHSGLSADSRVSPRRMAQVLAAAAARDDAAAPRLFDLLRLHPIDEADARAPKGAVVRAKTGTLDFTRGLAGYAVTPSGRRLAFAYFANDLDRRAASRGQDRPSGARAWRNAAVRLERALLRGWLTRFD